MKDEILSDNIGKAIFDAIMKHEEGGFLERECISAQ